MSAKFRSVQGSDSPLMTTHSLENRMRLLKTHHVLTVMLFALPAACSNQDTSQDDANTGGGGGMGGNPVTDPCENAEELPARINEDLTVGPGCIILDETVVENDAELTIEAGTTILVRPAGYLSISRYQSAPDDGGTLTAIGTAELPIVFTSIEEEPKEGDWGCVFLGDDAAGSELDWVELEYGGAPCGASGNGFEGEIVVRGHTRTLTNITATRSSSHGITILNEGLVQALSELHFSDNEGASLNIDANQLVSLGGGNTFADEDDVIEVEDSGMNRDGNILAQPVPYRFLAGATVGTAGAQPEIVVEAGVHFQLSGVSFVVQAGNLMVEGTESEPVVFSSSEQSPQPGDWGCLWFQHHMVNSQNTGVPAVSHAVFEYGGNDSCGNNNDWPAALIVTSDADLDGLVFDQIAGHGILTPLDACPENACDQTFMDLDAEALSCDDVPTACP